MRLARFGAATIVLVTVILAILFLMDDENLRSEEPAPQTLNFGQVIYVDDGFCDGWRVREVTGATPTTERTRRCVEYPWVKLMSHRFVHGTEARFGRMYALLVIIGSVAGGLAAIGSVWKFLRSFGKRT